MNNNFDYIIAGAGLAGLTLVVHICNSQRLLNKRILILDKDEKSSNDRTWSFWSRNKTIFDEVIAYQWKKGIVKDDKHTLQLKLEPYHYNTLFARDFYAFCKEKISLNQNITWLRKEVKSININQGLVHTQDAIYQGDYVFDSLYTRSTFTQPKSALLLWQHFKGHFIETSDPIFDPEVVTIMDFDTNQYGETRFFYVLPFSTHKALIEYTIFSKDILPEADYDQFLEDYKHKWNIKEHQILETEFSAIPMTDQEFPETKGKIVFIGTKGGFVKPSTGYAFSSTLRKVKRIVSQLEMNIKPNEIKHQSEKKYRFYDAVLLHALSKPRIHSPEVFMSLFKKIGPSNLFSFLDEESHLLEDMRVISSIPNKYKLSFLKTLPLWTRV